MKPGWKTTEFWALIAANIGSTTAAATDAIPHRYAALVAAISVTAYSISRGLAKFGGVAAPPPAPPPAQ